MLSVTLYNVYTMTENVSEMGQLDKVKVRSLIMFKKATIMFAKKLRNQFEHCSHRYCFLFTFSSV